MSAPRDLPEPAETLVSVGAIPMAAVVSCTAVFLITVFSLLLAPFACCAERMGLDRLWRDPAGSKSPVADLEQT